MINKAKSFDRHSLMQGQVEVKKNQRTTSRSSAQTRLFSMASRCRISYFSYKPAQKNRLPTTFLDTSCLNWINQFNSSSTRLFRNSQSV